MYSFENKKVLVAEDNEISREMIVSQLRDAGAEVVTACNGAEAIACVKENTFDFILMDAVMPVMNGFEASLEIRELGYSMPIVGISFYEPEYVSSSAEQSGMNALLEKPLDIEKLRKRLEGRQLPEVSHNTGGKSLLILCAGQFGRITKEIAETLGYEKIAFLDDFLFDSSNTSGTTPILGRLKEYRKFTSDFTDAIVAVDNVTIRVDYIEKLKFVGYHVPVLIHPTAFVAPSVRIGEGTIIQPMAAVNTGCTIGKGCIISMSANINHHSLIGDYCHISCNSTVMQNTKVKPCTVTTIGQLYLTEPSVRK